MTIRCVPEENCADTATCAPEDFGEKDASPGNSDAPSDSGGMNDGAGARGGSGGAAGSSGAGGKGGAAGAPDGGARGGSGGVKDGGGTGDSPDSTGTAGAGGSAGTGGGGAAGASGAGAGDASTGGAGGGGGSGGSSGGGAGGGAGSSDAGGPADAGSPPADASDGCVLNACGGCGILVGEPNKPCGQCGTYVCTADKTAVACENPDPNECGGCGVLTAKPGTSCGSCSAYVCDPGKSSVSCQDFSIKQLALGTYHSCVLLNTGGVRCWGRNLEGELGDGSLMDRSSPSATDVATGVRAIATRGMHTCALFDAGRVRCWGYGSSGQLGTGFTTNLASVPSAVVANIPNDVTAISVGAGFSCISRIGGGVRCWGANQSGELGVGSTDNLLLAPTSDISNVSVAAIGGVAAGPLHVCAISAGGLVRCWGDYALGALGVGDNGGTNVLTPPSNDLPGLTNVTALALGRVHTCALLGSGGVRCWGNSSYGQLGDGQTTSPVLAPPTSDVLGGASAIAAGFYHTCALLKTGSLHCWGKALGAGTTTDRSDTTYEVLTGVRSVAAGVDFTCAVVGPGEVRCWGANDYGQIGDGSKDAKTAPTTIPSFCPK